MSAIDFEITDDMVEFAAAASYHYIEGTPWDDAHPADQREYRAEARVSLKATAHLIAAAAIRRTTHRLTAERATPFTIGFLDRTATDYEAGVNPSA